MKATHFDVSHIEAIIRKIVFLFPAKSVSTAVMSFLCWSFDCNFIIIGTLFIMIIMDAITGVSVAVKNKETSSRGFFRTGVKLGVYFTLILVSRMVDKHVAIPFASVIMDSFLVLTESLSILENIGKLGFPVPTIILSKLKEFKDK